MISFEFIHRLFDKRQYELFAEAIYKKLYEMNTADEVVQWWGDSNDPKSEDYYIETPLGVTYIEFGKINEKCKRALMANILDNFYNERKYSINIIQSASIQDYSKAIKIKDQALKNISAFITKFKSTVWLNDKTYILEELKILKKDILLLKNILKLEVTKEVPKTNVKPIPEIKFIDPLSYVDPPFLQAFLRTEKLALGETGKFPNPTRCAAFCEILYEKKYLKQTKTRLITMNNFSKSKYAIDIKIALGADKAKKALREKHKTHSIKGMLPLNRFF